MGANNVTYYKSANWASVEGNFTPDDLREIAQKIEDGFKAFQDKQPSKKTKKGK